MAQKAARSLFWLLRCSQYLRWSSQHLSLSFSRNSLPPTPGSTGTFWEPHTLPCIRELVHDSLLSLLADNDLKPSPSLHQDQLSGSEVAQQPWGAVLPQSWGQWEDKFPPLSYTQLLPVLSRSSSVALSTFAVIIVMHFPTGTSRALVHKSRNLLCLGHGVPSAKHTEVINKYLLNG